MHSNLQPWHILLAALAGWVNRHQQHLIEYLHEENRVLKEQIGGQRLRLTDNQRRRLAVKGKAVGFKLLSQVATIVTPDTIMAWHRKLIAMKWDYSSRRKAVGRPRVMKEIAELVVRMARSTIANILKERGIDPAPRRKDQMSWRAFLKAHWDTLAAADLFTVEVWAPRGLVTYYVLLVMDLSTPSLMPSTRVVRSIKDECLQRMIFCGEASLHRALREYVVHYHRERNHQGLDNRLIMPEDHVGQGSGRVQCRERLGGMLRYYHQQVA